MQSDDKTIPAQEFTPWPKDDALKSQVGGAHYKDMAIQPAEFIHKNKIGYLEGNVIKYVCRHAAKGGPQDLRKAIHYCRLALKMQYGEDGD